MLRRPAFLLSSNVVWASLAVAVVVIAAILLWPPSSSVDADDADKKKRGVAIVSMIKDPKNIQVWLDRHRKTGIQYFFIRLEESPDTLQFLKTQPDVYVKVGESDGVNEYDNIQVRQEKWVNEALKLAAKSHPSLQWMIHIDSDELVVGDLAALHQLPDTVRTVWFQNVEAKFRDIPSVEDSCFDAARFVNCAEEPGQCAAYGNGKSAGRIAPDVSAHGPHRFKSDRSVRGADDKVDQILVEHYESCDFDMYKKKFKSLAVQDKKMNIPFSYYNESIDAAKTGSDVQLEAVYRKYRVHS
jgi:hypothetical protein